jgi:DNA mismatch repair ATPase MutS
MIKGSFVPANKMRLGLMDKLFVKIHTGSFDRFDMIIFYGLFM